MAASVIAFDPGAGLRQLAGHATELGGALARAFGGNRAWRPICVHKLRSKVAVLEYEAQNDSASPCERRIVKAFADESGARAYATHHRIWRSGFCPPSRFTVVRPFAYLSRQRLFVQEKAPGVSFAAPLFSDPAAALPCARPIARWLDRFHSSEIAAAPRTDQYRNQIATQVRDLEAAFPKWRARVAAVGEAIVAALAVEHRGPLVPTHGDFHPRNVYVEGSEKVTVIDLDTFGLGERAADVAYFAGQVATMGRLRLGSLAATGRVRSEFLDEYLGHHPQTGRGRLQIYLAAWFVENLHFELCALNTGKLHLLEPWIKNAENALFKGELLDLTEAPSDQPLESAEEPR